jgi:hypothetical protein
MSRQFPTTLVPVCMNVCEIMNARQSVEVPHKTSAVTGSTIYLP